jgi:hypothetical protein
MEVILHLQALKVPFQPFLTVILNIEYYGPESFYLACINNVENNRHSIAIERSFNVDKNVK